MEEAKGLIRTVATAEDPSLVRCFRGHEKSVASVSFSRDMYLPSLMQEAAGVGRSRWSCRGLELQTSNQAF